MASSSKLMKYASCRPSSPSEEHKSAAIKTTPGREAGEEEESRGRCEDDARTEQNIDAYRHDRSVCRIQTGGNRVSRNEVLHSESGNRELQFPNFNPMQYFLFLLGINFLISAQNSKRQTDRQRRDSKTYRQTTGQPPRQSEVGQEVASCALK